MTKKRFERIYADVDVFCRDHDAKGLSQLIEKEDYDAIVDLLNSLSEENEQLKHDATILILSNQDYRKENEQLKQDNNALIHLLENQSMIIQELHSKLLEYQIQEPIVLTKEDLELMGKAISYYTHGRYAE